MTLSAELADVIPWSCIFRSVLLSGNLKCGYSVETVLSTFPSKTVEGVLRF